MEQTIDYYDICSYVEGLMEQKESDVIEFKSALGGFPGSFWETYSSFANTGGGTIVLGVKEKNNTFILDDLTEEQAEKYQKEFWSGVNNKSKVNKNLLSNDDVILGDIKGAKVLLFYIPRARREDRPVHCTLNPYNGTYKRNYEGDFKCSEEEVKRMFADADVTRSADSRILKNFTINDLDPASLEQYRRMFDLANPGHVWLTLNDMDLLCKLGAYKIDRLTGEEGFTLAGLLMFGKTDSITDEYCLPYFFPDYRELNTDISDRWVDRICPDGTWEANLFQFYKRVYPKLLEVLPKPFQISGDTRMDDTPAHVAVREAFVNCLVHASYSINASIVILRRKNELVFSNPGSLLVSKQQYYEGGESVCRNLCLQKMFMMLGKAEKAGSGVNKIMSGWREANWNVPKLEESNRPEKVVLTLPLTTILDDRVKKELFDLFGDNLLNLDNNELTILALALVEEKISNERLRYVLNVHKYDITKLLRNLCHNGLLTSEGLGRGTIYRLVTRHNTSDSNVTSSGGNVTSSDPNVTSSSGNVTSSVEDFPLQRNRMSRSKLEKLICKSCTDWTSIEELSNKVGKSSQYLKGKVIKIMVEEGLLDRLYPEIPTHPNQKYRKKG